MTDSRKADDAAVAEQVAQAGNVDDDDPTRRRLAKKLRDLNASIRHLGGDVLVSEDAGRAMETHDLAIAVSNTSHRLRILTELA